MLFGAEMPTKRRAIEHHMISNAAVATWIMGGYVGANKAPPKWAFALISLHPHASCKSRLAPGNCYSSPTLRIWGKALGGGHQGNESTSGQGEGKGDGMCTRRNVLHIGYGSRATVQEELASQEEITLISIENNVLLVSTLMAKAGWNSPYSNGTPLKLAGTGPNHPELGLMQDRAHSGSLLNSDMTRRLGPGDKGTAFFSGLHQLVRC